MNGVNYIDLEHGGKGYIAVLHLYKEEKEDVRTYNFTKLQFCKFLQHMAGLLRISFDIHVL